MPARAHHGCLQPEPPTAPVYGGGSGQSMAGRYLVMEVPETAKLGYD